jgi:serine/threonine protein kinase/tetratricopeptide (TPR) repeat protein
MAQKCPKCNTINPADSKFCKECATVLPAGTKDEASFTRTLETTTDELARGTVFAGRYEIIEELGQGGMGRVYRAHDTKLNEEVALKLIKPEIAADKRTVERFHNEIKNARKISHPNVCRTHDLGEEGKTLYLTMEYIRGEDLKSLLHRTKALTVGAAVSVGRQIAEGLAEAHKQGIVHRDLKPGNVMIDKDGQAKIMDFGIARSLQGGGITGEGAIIGTPEYMSPEQVEGKPADARADIYALGIILFEMVTGQVPFEGETPFAIAVKHKSEPPPVPKKLAPQIPEGLSRLILKCLEKDKTRRYQTAEDLVVDLAAVEQALPTAERVAAKRKTITHHEVTVKFEPRKLAIPVAAIIILGIGGFFLWRNVIQRPAPPVQSAMPALALLPIRNSSGDASLDVWKDNLPTLLNGGLSQSRYIQVIDDYQTYGALKKLNLLNAEKFTPDELKRIGTEGSATHLISGNFLSAGNRFIVNLSLIDARTGAVLAPIQAEAPTREAIYESVDGLVKKTLSALKIPEQPLDEGTFKLVGDLFTRNPKALQYYIEGEKAHQAQKALEAVAAFEKAVEIDPGFARAYVMLGINIGNQGELAKRYQYVSKAFELRDKLPERERLLTEGAFYMLRESTRPKSIEAYRKVVKRFPEDYQGHWGLAFNTDVPSETIKELEYLLHVQNHTESALLYDNLTINYCLTDDYTKARETYQESLEHFPPDPWRHYNLGNLFLLEGNLDAAQKEYERALALGPNDPWIRALPSNIDWTNENQDKVLKTLNTILETQKDPAILDDFLVVIYMQMGRFKDTLRLDDRREAKEISGGNPNVWHNRMLIYRGKEFLQVGRPQIALEKLRAGLEYVKKEEDKLPEKDFSNLIHERRVSLIWQVCALCDLDRIEEAEQLQKELEALIPKYVKKGQKACYCMNTALSQGKIELVKKNASAALKALEISRQMMLGQSFAGNSDHAYFFDLLGDANVLAGRWEQAAEAYARIRGLQNGRSEWGAVYARSYYKLGKVLEQRGKRAEAREKYQKFLDLWKDADPGLPEVADAKKRLAAL